MPYVQRDPTGAIIGVFANAQPGYAEEFIQPGDPGLLPLSRARGHARVNQARDVAISAGVSWGSLAWDSDAASRANLTGAVSAFQAGVPVPAGFSWRTKDNADVPMVLTDLLGLAAAMLVHVNGQYEKSWLLKAQIDAATTPAEIDAVTW